MYIYYVRSARKSPHHRTGTVRFRHAVREKVRTVRRTAKDNFPPLLPSSKIQQSHDEVTLDSVARAESELFRSRATRAPGEALLFCAQD